MPERGSSAVSGDPGRIGLCRDCAHARIIHSDRGSEFLQCQLAFTDKHFAKYPRIPVLACKGYVRNPVNSPE